MRLYLDANVIVYLIEGAPPLRSAVLSWVDEAEAQADGLLITSYLSTTECCVKPLREGRQDVIAVFRGFFERERLLLADVTRSVLDQVTSLRVRYSFKTPDAIHLATAITCGATALLTADKTLARFEGLRVIVLDPGPP